MACMSSETGSMVFAIINLIGVCISTVSSLGMLIYWSVHCFAVHRTSNYNYILYDMFDGIAELAILAFIIGWFIFSLLTLVFSSILMNGCLKKKPQHIKAYFIYGVLVMCISVLGFALVLLGTPEEAEYNVPAIISVTIGLVLYGLILHMIRHAYTKMQTTNEQYSHKPLNEKC